MFHTPLSCILAELIRNKKLKTLEEYKQLRENKEAYTHFCDHFLPCVIGLSTWTKEVFSTEISKMASPSDEAWALLLLENSWDLWHQMAEYEEKGEKLATELRKKTKYTSTAGTSNKYEGWGDEGIPAYNKYVQMVREDREKNKEFDVSYLAYKKEEQEMKMSGGKQKRGDADIVLPVAIENDVSFLEGMGDLADV